MSESQSGVFTFTNRGIKLSARRWLPASNPRGTVIFVHGWGDHSGRYKEIGLFLADSGYAAFGLDFEGHGLSPGKRAFIADFQDLVGDLAAFVASIKAEAGGAPLFLCGYSMGGCVCATYMAFHENEVAGVVFNASALVVSKHISNIKKFLARILGGVLPRLPLANLTAGALMSRDPVQAAEYDADELTHHGKITAGTGRQLLLASERIEKHLDRIVAPFLVLQGTGDTLVDPEGAKAVYAVSPGKDKSIRLYPAALHDLFHESNREEILADLKDWLDARPKSNKFSQPMILPLPHYGKSVAELEY